MLSPLLYNLFTHDCSPIRNTSSIYRFVDDTTVLGMIRNNDESAYREEVQHLAAWCTNNNLVLKTTKTRELIVDFTSEKESQASTHPFTSTGLE